MTRNPSVSNDGANAESIKGPAGRNLRNRKRLLSLFVCTIIVLSTLLIGIGMNAPRARAAWVNHTVGNLQIDALTDHGRIIYGPEWPASREQAIEDGPTAAALIGLVIDQAAYSHTPGAEKVADCFTSNMPYVNQDDFKRITPVSMVVDDGITQRSKASFWNSAGDSGDDQDILVNQTVWTVANKDWAILQWRLNNIKGVDLVDVSLGLEYAISQVASPDLRYGLGRDSGDDFDGFDAANSIYWAQDVDGTSIGFASADVKNPINHYYSQDFKNTYTDDQYKALYANDTWLYNRLHAPSSVVGPTPGNRTTTVGWHNFNIPAGESKILTLTFAVQSDYSSMIAAIKDAQSYYRYVIAGFRITEFSDSGLLVPQSAQIEVYNRADVITDMTVEHYFSVDSGITPLTGTWFNNPVPPNQHAVFTLDPGQTINPEGDTIGLYHNVDGLIDEVSFGQEGVAPDPLDGESTARRYDDAMAEYTDEWLRNAFTGPTWGAQNDVGNIATFQLAVLNRVMFNPIDATEAYVELMQKKSWVNISGYRIVCDNEFIVPQGTILFSPNTSFVLTRLDSPAFFTNMNAAGDNIYLYDSEGNLLDMVGWNSPHTQGLFMSRSPDGNGTYQGYDDVSSQTAGWFFNQVPNLQITEFYVDSSSAQIEVYNPRGWIKVLVDPPFNPRWTLTVDGGALTGTWVPNTIPLRGHSKFTMTGGSPDDEGDTISLYYTDIGSILRDEVSFGIKGKPPDPLVGESTARWRDAATLVYTDNPAMWTRAETPTFGLQNDVPPPSSGSILVLNEVLFNPSVQEDGFVELYLKKTGIPGLNISGYKIVSDEEYVIPNGMYLDANYGFFHLTQPMDAPFFGSLDSSGDNVYLYDSTGVLLDRVGWTTAHDANKSMTRLPDGNGTANGFNDTTSKAAGWVFNQLPTLSTVLCEGDRRKWGDPNYFVWYSMNVTNFQGAADYIDVLSQSENGWTVELYEDDQGTPLADKETPPDGLPDTGLLAPYTPYQIWVKVFIPPNPSIWTEKTIIFAQSSLDTRGTDRALLRTVLYSWIEPDAYIEPPAPAIIYEKPAGALGLTNETTIALNTSGVGLSTYGGQDVIFILDSSGSMSGSDPDPDQIPCNIPFPQRVQASWSYVDNMGGEDRGGYVDFDGQATLMVPLSMGSSADNYMYLKEDSEKGLWCSDESGGTRIHPAIARATQELVDNGDPNHLWVEILLTDAGAGYQDLIKLEAEYAAASNIIIFTIGLNVDDPTGIGLLTYVASVTGGRYFSAPDASALTGIFAEILELVGGIAGYDPDPGSGEVMLKFALEQGIEYIDGTFQLAPGTIEIDPNPDKVTFNPTNTTLEWNWVVDKIMLGEYWTVMFDISSTVVGNNVPVNIVSGSSVTYETPGGNLETKEFPLVTIDVLSLPTIQPYITDVTVEPGGVNVVWTPVTGAELYELYGGPSQTSLDLDLADVIATVTAPQTWWLDTVNLGINDEYYYVVRAVDTDTTPDTRSTTSNTGGYYRIQFGEGLNTFSLPLQPFGTLSLDDLMSDMGATTISWLDGNNEWQTYPSTPAPLAEMGRGYVVNVSSATTHIFAGEPGAMIIYNDSWGFTAGSLVAATVTGSDVSLVWPDLGGGIQYYVYWSSSRDGFFLGSSGSYTILNGGLPVAGPPFVHFGAASSPGEDYYMVVPFDPILGLNGSSTYSIGVWTMEFNGNNMFGLPLRPVWGSKSADWFVDQVPNAQGIVFLENGEWRAHFKSFPEGVYDTIIEYGRGYELSVYATSRYSFVGW